MSYTQRKEQLDQEALKADPVLVCDPRRQDNGDLIFDANRLGWIGNRVFDATSGEMVFWKRVHPAALTTNDLYKPADLKHDYLEPFHPAFRKFDTVVFDPPYKLNGTPTDDDRYGANRKCTVPERMAEIEKGAKNCARLVAPDGTLLVKCMDQVSLHQIHFQTQLVIGAVRPMGFNLIGLLELTEPKPRPQRKQVTPRFNRSTLLAFHRWLPPARRV